MRAMILAAGLGTRLYPLTSDRTKPAVPFLNKPIVAFCVEYLKQHGITEIIVNLHHQPESVKNALGDGSRFGVDIAYSHEPEILGTAGALDKVRNELSVDDFVVVNGKLITDIDLAAAIETHRRRQAIATLVLRRNPANERYSMVEVDTGGRILAFTGFPQPASDASGQRPNESVPLMFASIHVLSPGIFDYIPRGVYSDSVRDVYPAAMAAGEMLTGYVGVGAWYEFSTVRRYLDISLRFLQAEGLNNSLGDGSVIEQGAEVSNCVLWQRARVEGGASLSRCILGDDVIISAETRLENMVVVRADRVPEVERGTRLGDNLVVPIA